jgi:ubiquinone/menaquinone biosynthesis C-methylase UbiE
LILKRVKQLKIVRHIEWFFEYLSGGGVFFERILVKMLSNHYKHKFRRDWILSSEKPHFEDQRSFFFNFVFSDSKAHIGTGPFLRGFFSSEVIKDGDKILEIGCGDGFFTMRFLAGKDVSVDAIDIEPKAIKNAKRDNDAENIKWHLLDAVNDSFPKEKYDVVVFDGAIGHFSKKDTGILLKKINNCLASDGIFIGSESLGIEGDDHLQYFDSLNDLDELFSPHFKVIKMKKERYLLKWCGFIREEAYWRCSNSMERFNIFEWQSFNKEVYADKHKK